MMAANNIEGHLYIFYQLSSDILDAIFLLALPSRFYHYFMLTGTNDCTVIQKEGITMGVNPVTGKFTFNADPVDLEINYMLHAIKSNRQ